MKNNKIKELLLLQNRKRLEQYQARFLRISLFVLIGGYVFFFSSPLWMPLDYMGVTASEIGEEKEAEDRTIRLMKWDYAEEQREMEIILEIDDNALDGVERYEYSAMDRNQGGIQINPIIQQKNMVVLHLEEIPRRWAELYLQISLPESATREFKESGELARFYMTRKDVQQVAEIEEKPPRFYAKEILEETIQMHKEEIRGYERNIQEELEVIAEAEETIQELRKELKFETENEQLTTQENIHAVETEKQAARDRIEEQEGLIQELEAQNRLLKKKEETL